MVRSIAPTSPGAPSLITSSGQTSPRSPSPVKKPSQASPDSLEAPASPTNTGLPSVSMPQPASTGSAAALAWYLKWLTVEEQVVQLNVVEAAGTPRLELNFDLGADP